MKTVNRHTAIAACLLTLAAGLLIGHFTAHKQEDPDQLDALGEAIGARLISIEHAIFELSQQGYDIEHRRIKREIDRLTR